MCREIGTPICDPHADAHKAEHAGHMAVLNPAHDAQRKVIS
jgi:hypothetical protein